MIEKFVLKNEKEESKLFNPPHVYNDVFIDLNKKIENPPIAISIGDDYNNNPIPFVTYGNFACIVGASKSYKSFLKSSLLSCYIGGQSQNYFSDIKGHDNKKMVLDIDTEQGLYHVQSASKRVISAVGTITCKYKSYALRALNTKDRVSFIEYLINEKYKGEVGLLSIDGAADLIDNVNDLEASNAITQKIMSWTTDHNIALITVLHRNFETNKPTGHLGSAILKKAETVLFVNKDNNTAEALPKYTRNIPFESFQFKINEQGFASQIENIF